MFEQPPTEAKEETLSIIKHIETDPNMTQRVLSHKLGFSLGKTNYLLKELIKKGLIKAKSFSSNPGKMRKINYILTEKGLEEKMRLTYHFLKRKEMEYNLIRQEWERLNGANNKIQNTAVKEESLS